jgi:integrase/recombinase XerD
MRVERVASGGYELRAENAETVVEANRFLETVRVRGLSLATSRAYAFDLLMLLRWCATLGHHQISALTSPALLGFISFQQHQNASPRSINRRLVTCTLFYRFVTGHELAVSAGTAMAAQHYRGAGREHALGLFRTRRRQQRHLRVKTPRKLIEPLNSEQVKEFIHSLRRYRDLAIVYLMLFCGLRSFEVLSIKLGDLDIQQAQLRVFGKGNRERLLPLPALLKGVLADYVRLERPQNTTTSFLFVVLQGCRRAQPLTLAGLRSLFRHRRQSRAQVANANAHRFRHTFGADMARAGVGLVVLQRMMGHADPSTTLQYINLSIKDLTEEYNKAVAVIERRYEQST